MKVASTPGARSASFSPARSLRQGWPTSTCQLSPSASTVSTPWGLPSRASRITPVSSMFFPVVQRQP